MALNSSVCKNYILNCKSTKKSDSSCTNSRSASSAEVIQKQHRSKLTICVRENHSVCYNASKEFKSLTEELKQQHRKPNICDCGKNSVCYNVSKEYDSLTEALEKQNREQNICGCGKTSVCYNASKESDLLTEELQTQHRKPNICDCGKNSVCYNASKESDSLTEELQKQHRSKSNTCVREKQSVCYNASNCKKSDSLTEALPKQHRKPNICNCGKNSVCYNASKESDLLTEELQKQRREPNICGCGKTSVCYNASKESDLLTEELQTQHSKSNICVREEHSVCYNASKESDSLTEELQKQRREPNICGCGKTSVCYNASKEYDSLTEALQMQHRTKSNICVREKHSVCYNASKESDPSTEETEEEDYRQTSLFDYPCGNYSTCYDMTEEQDPFIEELLKYLARPRDADESRGHWEMMLHCERAAFPRATPNLPLPSREARFYWHLYSTAARHSPLYQKNLNLALRVTLAKLSRSRARKRCISIWEQLIRLKTFDRVGRKGIINHLKKLLYKQTGLESICLEGLSLTPDEGVQLLLALYNSRKTMRYVYCWRAFEKMVGLAVDTDRPVGSRFYADKRIKKCDWFRAIGSFEFLTTLSVNYAYIATPTGDLLVNLAKKLGRNWRWLQLLCMEDEILREHGSRYSAAVLLPDDAWRHAHFWAPALKVQYAIIGIPQYDVHKKFLTESTEVHTFALSTSIDLRFRHPWYLNCTIKTLCTWYSSTLVYLSLQLWHNREDLDKQLKKLFLKLPALEVFEFIGEIRTLKTLCAMCCQIRSRKCNVRCVNMQLQEVVHDDTDKEKWVKSVKCLTVCFKHDFARMGVKFDIDFYRC